MRAPVQENETQEYGTVIEIGSLKEGGISVLYILWEQ